MLRLTDAGRGGQILDIRGPAITTTTCPAARRTTTSTKAPRRCTWSGGRRTRTRAAPLDVAGHARTCLVPPSADDGVVALVDRDDGAD